jgi:hypothetical protein
LLNKYALKKKIIIHVKDEGSNFNAMINALKSIVSCECFGAETSFQGSYFGHVFSKACQYDSTDEKICKNFKYVYVKSAQIDLQKCIT